MSSLKATPQQQESNESGNNRHSYHPDISNESLRSELLLLKEKMGNMDEKIEIILRSMSEHYGKVTSTHTEIIIDMAKLTSSISELATILKFKD